MFKIGQTVIFNPRTPERWAARPGATATVTKPDGDGGVVIEWNRLDTLVRGQMDGEYSLDDLISGEGPW